MSKNIGKMIRKIRTDYGLTRAEFSRMIDYSHQYMTFIERGDRRMTTELLLKILSVKPFSNYTDPLVTAFKKQFNAALAEKRKKEFDKLPQ